MRPVARRLLRARRERVGSRRRRLCSAAQGEDYERRFPASRLRSGASWDFIVVGAGSAGCVLAGDLARAQPERPFSVLLLEAGPEAQRTARVQAARDSMFHINEVQPTSGNASFAHPPLLRDGARGNMGCVHAMPACRPTWIGTAGRSTRRCRGPPARPCICSAAACWAGHRARTAASGSAVPTKTSTNGPSTTAAERSLLHPSLSPSALPPPAADTHATRRDATCLIVAALHTGLVGGARGPALRRHRGGGAGP